uniref:Receptor-like protein kinase 5 n=1 Tax=Rhizophora mucronata TaxID=61149 RepID=A0A2P2MWR4_RHIMU
MPENYSVIKNLAKINETCTQPQIRGFRGD